MTRDNILVAIKSRQFIIPRRSSETVTCPQWLIEKNNILLPIDENLQGVGEPYKFDHVFTEENTNADIYNAVVKTLIRSCLEGFNSTVLAYGQTSSGKTYTMMGDKNTPGLIQLAVTDIFKQVQQDKQRRYLISCSYIEIYNEKINNLLEENEIDLKIREDCNGNTFIIAKEQVVTDPAQIFELINIGNKIRKTRCTNMNERSSRSHTIFRITIESTDNSIADGPVQVSLLNLVDLAGSERVALSKAEGKHLEEGVNINKSLTVLRYVIRQLSDSERHINYRDSKLTRLLQPAFGGNTKSLIIATISLAAGEETKTTLDFAQRAKAVKNKPIINEILSESEKLKQYELKIAAYKKRLDVAKQRMKEMEIQFQQEKFESQKEIAKLKGQCKLIDFFAKGPASKPDSKISRRHTVGYYGSVGVLEPIPEVTVVPSTSYIRPEGSTCKRTSTLVFEDIDEKILKIEETSDSVSAEPMDETSRSTQTPSPEPSQYESIVQQGGETPPSFLHKRIKILEESYTSQKEFTKLESESKEKDNKELLKELVSGENTFLKFEVQGLMQALEDYKCYNDKQASEIEELKKQLGQGPSLTAKSCPELTSYGRADTGKKDCATGETKKDIIKRLENLHKGFCCNKGDLESKIYNLLNSANAEKKKRDEVESMLRFENSQLKKKLRIGQSAEVEYS